MNTEYHKGNVVLSFYGGTTMVEIRRPDGTILCLVGERAADALLAELNSLLKEATK